jgi:uncharacterized protein (TIGR03067 family)
MRSLLGLVVVLGMGSVWAQETKPDEATAKELKALEGTWDLEQLEVAGKKTPVEELKKVGAKIEIKGDAITFASEVKKEGKKGTIRLNVSKTPREIDVDDGKKGKELGIYELKDDTLKICTAKTGGERPKEFASKATPETTLLVFKRAAAKK